MTEKDLLKEINDIRRSMPLAVRQKYDTEAGEVLRNFRLRRGFGKTDAALQRYWEERVALMLTVPEIHHAPPRLMRMSGESLIDYVDRCAAAMGKGARR